MTILGITGTRTAPTPEQLRALAQAVVGAHEVHHGDCVGADRFAHYAALAVRHARSFWPRIVIHPPKVAAYRAFCLDADAVEPERHYRERNAQIVQRAGRLFALPSDYEKRAPRSGTWMTVRMARRHGVPVEIVLPDGVRIVE